MSAPHPTVRRTWRARLPVEFSHFVLFMFQSQFVMCSRSSLVVGLFVAVLVASAAA